MLFSANIAVEQGDVVVIVLALFIFTPGPSPGYSSRGGQKPERGAKNQKGGAQF